MTVFPFEGFAADERFTGVVPVEEGTRARLKDTRSGVLTVELGLEDMRKNAPLLIDRVGMQAVR